MRLLVFFFLLFLHIISNGQVSPTRNWVYSEDKYKDFKGNSVMISNSFPKGGGVVDNNGKNLGYRVFWNRIRNESISPIDFHVKFPEATFVKPKGYPVKIVLPKENMKYEKIQLFDFGLTNLQSLFNDESNQLSFLDKKISPKEDYFFYVIMFIQETGTARAELILKGINMYYKIKVGSDSTLIPCGNLTYLR